MKLQRNIPLESRRAFLLATGSGLLLPGCALDAMRRPARIDRDPFQLGVASGDPRSDGMVLWTRLAPNPIEDESGAGGMPDAPFEVEWEIADDERMRKILRSGVELAEPAWGHSLHIEVRGLDPDRPYWFRFRAGAWLSPVGRTRTLPSRGAQASPLEFAFVSCQNYETGYYAAYRHLSAEQPDLILHLGDYIYESSGWAPVRQHESSREPRSQGDYRRRHACYRLDPDLQGAHAIAPWLCIWDDHEVDNDYAGLRSAEWWTMKSAFSRRRAAAYQAYWEHMPLPLSARPSRGHLQLHQRAQWGDLLRIHLLDTRQYRDDQPCGGFFKRGGQVAAACEASRDPQRSMLGATQEQWLAAGLEAGAARWNLIAQPMLMSTLDQKPGEGQAIWTDGWDAYPGARARLLGTLEDSRADNPFIIGGDIHSYWASSLPNAAGSRPLASHFVGSSISSPGMSPDYVDALKAENPHIQFADSRYRGYVSGRLDQARLEIRYRALRDARDRASEVFDLARWAVEAGSAEVLPA